MSSASMLALPVSGPSVCHRGPHVFKCGCWLCPTQVGLPALRASVRLQPVCWPCPCEALLSATTVCLSLSVGAGFARPKSVCQLCVPAHVFSQYAGPACVRPFCPPPQSARLEVRVLALPAPSRSASFVCQRTSSASLLAPPISCSSHARLPGLLLPMCMSGYVYCPNFAVTTTMTILPKFVPRELDLHPSTLPFRHQRFGHQPFGYPP
jgi:hypothetical protein